MSKLRKTFNKDKNDEKIEATPYIERNGSLSNSVGNNLYPSS